jgi:flagellar hook capping protein FlgD
MTSFRHPQRSLSRIALFLAAVALLPVLSAAAPGILPRDVSPPSSSDSSFVVGASVTPASAPIGAPFDFYCTVTNTGSVTARFYVDGCPVRYVVDQTYEPIQACILIAREIVLEPGQSITFGPESEPELHFDPHRFPIGPGEHKVVMRVGGVGEAAAAFQVEAPATDLAYAAGRVVRADGSLPRGFVAFLVSPGANVGASYQSPVSPEGYFFFDGVSPGTYLLWVGNDMEVWWYPGVQGPDLATPIQLGAGQYVGGLDVTIPGGPNPGLFTLSGQVFEATTDSLNSNPLAQAMVVALPVQGMAPPDTGVAPGDSTGAGLPNTYPDIGTYFALTNGDGLFTLELPEGSYRLVAGKPGSHRYQYFNHVYHFAEAAQYPVPSRIMAPIMAPRFDLPPLTDNHAVLTGQVLGYNPLADAMPQPLEGATVTAMPVFPRFTTEVLIAHTASDGTFHLEVPAETPYRVVASANGYDSRYFQNAMNYMDATPVDVTPGETTSGIDFSLPETLPGMQKGAIEGLVLRRLSENCTGYDPATGTTQDSCLVPAAGALVRITPAFPTLVAVEYQTYTGEDGRFRIDGLLAQADGYLSYYVSAEMNGMEPAYYPGGVPFSEAQTLPVLPDQTSDAGTIVLGKSVSEQHGFIAGRITDPDQHPLEHALVRVFVDPGNPWGLVARAFSGPDGTFYLDGLPAGASVIVSAEATGYVPLYYPHVYRWKLAEPVAVSAPNTRTAPLQIVLDPAAAGGPFIQAGLVVVEPDSVGSDSGWVDPTPLSARARANGALASRFSRFVPASIAPRIGALTYEIGVRDAFFYVVNALAMGPMERPVAGGSTGDNGAAILRGLPAGQYIAYADRPGFASAYFSDAGGNPVLITLNDTTPAVLAWIALHPQSTGGPPQEAGDAMLHNLTNVPNPFGPQTAIRYTLTSSTPVTIQVFDQSGRLVRMIKQNDPQSAGPQEVSWDARDQSGRQVSSGVYFARILAGPDAFARKMVLLP